jgi:hypothetical protein
MNAKDEKGAQTQDVFSMIDTGAKAVAILGGLSVLVGTTFNVSFFLATNSEWLFYLSIADNLTATLYALPVVTATGLILGAGMGALRGADWSVVFGYLVSVVLFAGYLLWRGTLFKSSGLFTIALTLIVLLSAFVRRVSPSFGQAWATSILFIVFLVVAVSGIGVLKSEQPRMTVNIDLTDYGSSHPVLTGQIVRHLDNGIILAQDTGWVWIPKDQVRRVTEVGGKR